MLNGTESSSEKKSTQWERISVPTYLSVKKKQTKESICWTLSTVSVGNDSSLPHHFLSPELFLHSFYEQSQPKKVLEGSAQQAPNPIT